VTGEGEGGVNDQTTYYSGCHTTLTGAPTRRHAMITPVLAADPGKFNSVPCWYNPRAGTGLPTRHGVIPFGL
jgi:hypothetical protein